MAVRVPSARSNAVTVCPAGLATSRLWPSEEKATAVADWIVSSGAATPWDSEAPVRSRNQTMPASAERIGHRSIMRSRWECHRCRAGSAGDHAEIGSRGEKLNRSTGGELSAIDSGTPAVVSSKPAVTMGECARPFRISIEPG